MIQLGISIPPVFLFTYFARISVSNSFSDNILRTLDRALNYSESKRPI